MSKLTRILQATVGAGTTLLFVGAAGPVPASLRSRRHVRPQVSAC